MDQMTNLPPTPSPVQEVAPKGHIFIKVLLVVLVLGGLGGGGAFAYFKYFAEVPEMQIYKAFTNTEEIKTYSFDLNISAKGKILSRAERSLNESLAGLGGTVTVGGAEGEQKADTQVFVGIKGDIDKTTAKQVKSQLTFTVGGKQEDKEVGPLVLNYFNDSNVVAFRVPKIPPMKDMDFSDLDNQWVSYDYSKFKGKLDALVEEQKEKANKNFSDEDEKRILALAKKIAMEKPPITVTQKLKKEMIGGVETQPYAFIVSKENVIYLVETLAKDEKAGIQEKDITELKEMLAEVKKLDGTVWVGGKGTSLLPYKLSLAGIFEDAKTKEDVNVTFTIAFTNVNKPVVIESPKNAMSFEDAFNIVMTKMAEVSMKNLEQDELGGTGADSMGVKLEAHNYVFVTNVRENNIDMNLSTLDSDGKVVGHMTTVPNDGFVSDKDSDGLDYTVERLFGTDSNKPDSDGDGLNDGDEVNKYKTHPAYKDTDEDGYDDGMEIKTGHDPLKK